jgi:hypothetical protein
VFFNKINAICFLLHKRVGQLLLPPVIIDAHRYSLESDLPLFDAI